jgi:hypothetical protein
LSADLRQSALSPLRLKAARNLGTALQPCLAAIPRICSAISLSWARRGQDADGIDSTAIPDITTSRAMEMVMTKEPEVFYPFVDETIFRRTISLLPHASYQYGAISNNPNFPIWKAEIDPHSDVAQTAFHSLFSYTSDAFSLVECHLNLQTHGLDGSYHVDNDPEKCITHSLIWYVHPYDWPQEYGGYLLIGHDHHSLRAILPSRNLAVLIDAAAPHCATSPQAYAGAKARISLALKLQKLDSETFIT